MPVYFDNAASTPLRDEVFEAMTPYLKSEYGNPSSVHSHGRRLRSAVEKARKTVADLLGVSPAEIVFTGGGTEADNMAICCGALFAGVDTLISSPLEHHAVSHSFDYLKKTQGKTVKLLSPDSEGRLDLSELETLLKTACDQRPSAKYSALVSLMHGNNEIATLNPIDKIAALCREYRAVYHADTVQTFGHYELKANKIPAHFMVGSAHKFYGPKGVGVLYRDSEMLIAPLIFGGGQERNLRAGTENVAGIVGLAVAFELAQAERETKTAHLRKLKTYFIERLRESIPGVRFNGVTDPEGSMPTVLNVAFPSDDVESLLLFNFDIHQVSVSGGSACTSGSVHPSHVLAAIGCSPERMANSIRFSFGGQNTLEEVDRAIEVARMALNLTQAAVSA